MPKASLDDVWLFIYDKSEVRTRDLEAEFVKTKRIARGTLYKYKRVLEAGGKIQAKSMQGRPPYNIYFVPPQYHAEIEALKQYKQVPLKYFPFAAYNKRSDTIPDTLFPHVAIMGNIHELEWNDIPPSDIYSDFKMKVLWRNSATGAVLLLFKCPPGLSEKLHYHEHANHWGLYLAGEGELPDGTRIAMEGIYAFIPKGTPHMQPKITKETLVLCYFDGPTDETLVQP